MDARRKYSLVCILALVQFLSGFTESRQTQTVGKNTGTASDPVPITEEPHHHLVFHNEYVRVFDVAVANGDTTLFHTHSNDYLFVAIGDAKLEAQVPDGQPSTLNLKSNEVRFQKAPFSHRIINHGDLLFRNLTIEILKNPDAHVPESSMPKIRGHSVVLENDRVRVERVILDPGQTTGMHTHVLQGLGVILSEATLEVSVPGKKTQTIQPKPDTVSWHDANTHCLTNVGSTRFEALDIEWK